MILQIKSRFTSAILFTAELEARFESEPDKVGLGQAIKQADLRDADLRGADLSGAALNGVDMRDADLRDADLRGAVLSGALLRDADLRDANLSGAVLNGVDLSGAVLSGAVLRGAVLREAHLSGVDLSGSVLNGAVLNGADLRDADLRAADLRDSVLRDADPNGADLNGAVLSGADLREFKQDLIAEVLKLPNELEAIRDALAAGRINGTTYSTEDCSCLAGTIAKQRGIESVDSGDVIEEDGCKFQVDRSSPRERWFMNIRAGDKPETNQCSALALEWIKEAITIRDHIRKLVAA